MCSDENKYLHCQVERSILCDDCEWRSIIPSRCDSVSVCIPVHGIDVQKILSRNVTACNKTVESKQHSIRLRSAFNCNDQIDLQKSSFQRTMCSDENKYLHWQIERSILCGDCIWRSIIPSRCDSVSVCIPDHGLASMALACRHFVTALLLNTTFASLGDHGRDHGPSSSDR